MTRHEFNAATKQNMGGNIASDERCAYREERMLPHNGSGSHNPYRLEDDFITRRAARITELRRYRSFLDHDGDLLATLGRGSPFRAPASYRARVGDSMLAGRR